MKKKKDYDLPKGLNVICSGGRWMVWKGVAWTGTKPHKDYYKSETEAVKAATALAKEREKSLTTLKSTGLAPAQLGELRVAQDRLGGASILDAVAFYLERRPDTKKTFGDLMADLLKEKKEEKLGDVYLKDLKEQFAFFQRVVSGDTLLVDFKRDHAMKIIKAKDGSGNTPSASREAKRLRYLRIVIKAALARDMIVKNPLSGIKTKKDPGSAMPVSVLSPELAAQLIYTAQYQFEAMLLPILLKLFSGVRNSELRKIPWSSIQGESIEIQAAHSKTGKTRAITISPVLKAWLGLIKRPEDENQLVYNNRPTRKNRKAAWSLDQKELAKLAGIAWRQNYLRHTFGSYHFHTNKNARLTSWEMGNSPDVVKSNYTKFVTKEDCEKFWRLLPSYVEILADKEPLPDNAPTGALEVDEPLPTPPKSRRPSTKRPRRSSKQA